jgi:hypothetical protein
VRFPQMRFIPTGFSSTVPCAWKEPIFAAALSEAMPMLDTWLLPSGVHPDNYPALSRFSSLQTIQLGRDFHRDLDVDAITVSLSPCHALTALEFRIHAERSFFPEQWSVIFTSAQSWTSLRFHQGLLRSFAFLDSPIGLQQLWSQSLECIDCDGDFDQLARSPSLTSLTIHNISCGHRPDRDLVEQAVLPFASLAAAPALEDYSFSGQGVLEWSRARGITQWINEPGNWKAFVPGSFRIAQPAAIAQLPPPPPPSPLSVFRHHRIQPSLLSLTSFDILPIRCCIWSESLPRRTSLHFRISDTERPQCSKSGLTPLAGRCDHRSSPLI